MIIDTHVHLYEEGFWSSDWFDYVAYKWASSKEGREPFMIRDRIESGMMDAQGDRLIEHMDSAGIDLAVLLPLDWELGLGESKISIEDLHERHAAAVAKHPGRLISFAGVDPRRPNSVELFKWCIKDLGMKGLKLYPPCGFYPYDDAVLPLLQICHESQLPVLVHTGATIDKLSPRFANPIFLQDVLAKLPGLQVWLGHSGVPFWWDEAVQVAASSVHTYLEVSNWEAHAYRQPKEFAKKIADALRRIGPEKIIFGSDHFSGERFHGVEGLIRWVEWWRETMPQLLDDEGVKFGSHEIDLMLGANASRCLAIGGSRAS